MAEALTIREWQERGDELPRLAREALDRPNVLLDGAWRQTPLARRMLAGGWGVLPEKDGTVVAQAFGWPARCLWGHRETVGAGADRHRGFVLIIHRRWRLVLVLPTMPVPAGFVIDALFYAVPWWVMLIMPGAIKRWRRNRRGACLACGYDLRGLGHEATCPECGT